MKRLLYLLCSLLLAFAILPICRLFTLHKVLQYLLAVITGFSWSPFLFQLAQNSQTKKARKDLQYFLQVCISFLNVGHSLNVSMAKAVQELTKLKQRTSHKKSLLALQHALGIQQSTQQFSNLFLTIFPCPEAKLFFHLLEQPSLLGSDVRILFRQYENSLRQEQEYTSEKQADESKNLVECISLQCMPVLIVCLFYFTAYDFYKIAFSNVLTQALLLVAYILFFLSGIYVRKIFIAKIKKKFKTKNSLNKKYQKSTVWNEKNILLLPYMQNKVEQSIEFLSIKNKVDRKLLRQRQNFQRIRFYIYGLSLFLLGMYLKLPLVIFAILSIFLVIYSDYRLVEDCNEMREFQLQYLPSFFHYLLLCIRAGFSIPVAIHLACSAFYKEFPLLPEIERMHFELENRLSLEKAIENFSTNIAFAEAATFMHFLFQHSVAGGAKDIELLQLQINQFQQLLRAREKRRIARKSNRYLIPMLFNFVSVMIICIAPVLPSFQL